MPVFQDIRYGFRLLGKSPGFTSAVVVVLALGIGANTAIFTLVNAVLFRPLPFKQGDRIMMVDSSDPKRSYPHLPVSYPDFQDWRAQARTFSGFAAWWPVEMNLADGGAAPQRYTGARITANAFSLLGQAPVLGRDFAPEDERPGAPDMAIISHEIWMNRYGGGKDVLGRTVRINEVPATVIGVMPPSFKFPIQEEIWLAAVPKPGIEQRERRFLYVFGRLSEGAGIAEARAEMDLIARRLEKAYPKTNLGIGVNVETFNERFNGGPIRTIFLSLLGAVGFVLFIACANVANLLLARSVARTREVAIRIALGAGRARVVRQLLVESLLLSLAGGALGLGLALAGIRAFDLAVASVVKPYWIRFTMDMTVFAYVAGICVLTGVVFGIVPALSATKVNLNERLKEGGRSPAGSSRARHMASVFVVAEVALSVVLLAGTGLLLRSLIAVYTMQVGTIDAENVLNMRVNLVKTKYPDTAARWNFYDRLMPQLRRIPGAAAVTIASHAPVSGSFNWSFDIEGQPLEKARMPSAAGLVVDPSYFPTLEIPVLRGRNFNGEDGMEGREAAIVNQRFAAKFLPRQDAIGKRIRLITGDTPGLWLTVVGVVPDIRQNDPSEREIAPEVYVPLRQEPIAFGTILARTSVPPETAAEAFRRALASVDPDLPAFGVMPLSELFATQRWHYRVFGSVFGIFAIFALILAAMGVYGVVAYSVSRRTAEIGIRVALGAGTWRIVRMVLLQGAMQLAAGVVIGLTGAFSVTRVLRSILVQVSPADPATFATVALLLLAAGGLACMVPAWRAARIDPTRALRYE
jgi:putative ABC transport system permease protein